MIQEKNQNFEMNKEEIIEEIELMTKNLQYYRKLIREEERKYKEAILKNPDIAKLAPVVRKNSVFNYQLPDELKEQRDFIYLLKKNVKGKTEVLKNLKEKLQEILNEEQKKLEEIVQNNARLKKEQRELARKQKEKIGEDKIPIQQLKEVYLKAHPLANKDRNK